MVYVPSARAAELLRRIFEVDPLTCPRCQGLMRIVAVISEPAVITRILAHRVRARDPIPRVRSPPPRRRRSLTPTGATPPHPYCRPRARVRLHARACRHSRSRTQMVVSV
jgi:hypothetical protein